MTQEQTIRSEFYNKWELTGHKIKYVAYYILYTDIDLQITKYSTITQTTVFRKYLTLKNVRIAQQYYLKKDIRFNIKRVVEQFRVVKEVK